MFDGIMLFRFGLGISLAKFNPAVDVQDPERSLSDLFDPIEVIRDNNNHNIYYILERTGFVPTQYEARMSDSDDFEELVKVVTLNGSEGFKNRLESLTKMITELKVGNGTYDRVVHSKP